MRRAEVRFSGLRASRTPERGELQGQEFDGEVGAELLEGADAEFREVVNGTFAKGTPVLTGELRSVEEDQLICETRRESGAVELGAGFEKDT